VTLPKRRRSSNRQRSSLSLIGGGVHSVGIASGSPAIQEDARRNAGMGQALLQLFSMFEDQKQFLLKWLGTKTYESATRMQKKGAKVKSGSILDRKIE